MGRASRRGAANGAPKKVGLMGGTFDPIHQGHLDCAEAAVRQLGLDQVLFIPAGVPVYKLDKKIAPAQDRVSMVRQAIRYNSKFRLDTCEIARGGKTYTADTLRELRKCYPAGTQFVLIAGVDAALTIPLWRESAVIEREARIAVVTRPGYPVDKESDSYRNLMTRFLVTWVEADTADVSSSQVRAAISRGEDASGLVPAKVLAYISQQGLYTDSIDEECEAPHAPTYAVPFESETTPTPEPDAATDPAQDFCASPSEEPLTDFAPSDEVLSAPVEGAAGVKEWEMEEKNVVAEGQRLVAIYRAAAGIEVAEEAAEEAAAEVEAAVEEAPQAAKKSKKAAKKAKKAAKKAEKAEKKAAKKAKKKAAKKAKKAEKKAAKKAKKAAKKKAAKKSKKSKK